MAGPVLDDVLAVNDELAALANAGVDLELGLHHLAPTDEAAWAQVGASLGRDVGRGESVEQALRRNDTAIGPTYRNLMLLGVRFNRLNLALDSARAVATVADQSRDVARAGVLYPLFLSCLAYVGMIAFLRHLVPILVETYDVPGMRPGYWLESFDRLRANMSTWIWIPPLLVLLWMAWRLRRNRQHSARPSWLADALHVTQKVQLANFSEMCAALLDERVPRAEALQVAAGASGHQELFHAVRSLEAVWRAGGTVEAGDPLGQGLPPLVRWALLQPDSEQDRAAALRAAAMTYRQAATVRTEQAQRWLPVLLVVVVGGGVVMLYGLMLFLPLRELLEALAQ